VTGLGACRQFTGGMGYENVRGYDRGKKDWTDAGLPTEGKY